MKWEVEYADEFGEWWAELTESEQDSIDVAVRTASCTRLTLDGPRFSSLGERNEIMRYWDDDHPEWDAEEQTFAAAWRNPPKWVVSRSLKSVGPNARLAEGDLERAIRELKAEREGEIEVAGPNLAHRLTELGLIDEYRIYLHPVVLGQGEPFFAGPRPPLRLMAMDRIDEDVIRLVYVPA
jgi:riboflavin biosynthesis pyrimidine reductase